jgi:hypothetical protein
MSTLVTATVLRWAVEQTGEKQIVCFKESTPITVVVSDTVSNTDAGPVLAEYILKNKNKSEEFLQAARDGLLQVVGMSRVPLTAPAVPPCQPASAGGKVERAPTTG